MQELNSKNPNSTQRGLRRILLDLYNKSGANQVLHPSIYSDSDKTTDSVNSPSFSMLGETTPDTFYGALDEKMISEGLLPRFLIIEYNGPRVPTNEHHALQMPTFQLAQQLAELCGQCLTQMHKGVVTNVLLDSDAQQLMKSFDKYVDHKINEAPQDTLKHLWNRAHIKALKLSALVAVGINPFNPLVTVPIAEWALSVVQSDTNALANKFEKGEIGRDSEETKQISKVTRIMVQYVVTDYRFITSYGIKNNMHNDKVIPWLFIQRRLSADSAFRNDRLGATAAIKRSIQVLLDNGDIREIGKNDLANKYGFTGKAFVIVNGNMLER